MNSVQRVLSAISEADLRTAVAEMNTFGATGVLENGVVRRVAKELAAATGVNAANALPIVQTHVVRAAAFIWAGLPVFPEYPENASAEPAPGALAVTSNLRTPAENEAAAAPLAPSSHVLPGSLVGKVSPKFPGALCWEHTCAKAGGAVLLPFGMKCADCQSADVATPRQRTAALLLGYRRAAMESNAEVERRAGEALVALVEVLANPGAQAEDTRRAATRAEVLSDVDPVVLECWKLQGRKVGAMLADAQAAVIELQEKLEDATDGAPLNVTLSCGCKSAFHGFPAEWDTETRECTPAVASGNICERHYHEWDARPASVPHAAAVDAAYKELSDAWLAYNGTHHTAKRMNLALGMLGVQLGVKTPESSPASPLLEGASLSAEHVLEAPTVYLDAANKLRARPDKGNALAAARLLEDVYLATKDGAPKLAELPAGKTASDGERVTRLTVAQCAAQFRMYAGSHLNDASAQHQLNFCANFLEEFCTAPDVPAELLEALDSLMRVAHNLRRDGKERPLSTPECAVLTADERVRKAGWSWDPMAFPTVKHTPPAAAGQA